jgi:hypothetical protein
MKNSKEIKISSFFSQLQQFTFFLPFKSPLLPPVDPRFVSSANNPTAKTPIEKIRKAGLEAMKRFQDEKKYRMLPQMPETP